MSSRHRFASRLAELKLSHAERAIAFLWYYRQTEDSEERTVSELATDLHSEGFPRPNITRLRSQLARNRFTVRGTRPGAFKLDLRQVRELDDQYRELLRIKRVAVAESVLPSEWVAGTRGYLEGLVRQINGCYEYGFFDGCAVLCRRLMESLIIEIYVAQKRQGEIQSQDVFLALDKLISHIRSDNAITLGRNMGKTMLDVKQLGDTAAHDRVYITEQNDIDDITPRYRRVIRHLLSAAKLVQ